MKRIVNALGKLNWRKRAYAVLVLCATTATVLPAQTFTTLHSFDGTDGCCPNTDLVQATNGYLYGAANFGTNGDGTVFKMTPSGTLTTLHSFDGTDGEFSNTLVQAPDGNLYGTAEQGGTNGDGTVFKITPEGTLTTLHNFNWTDGYSPWGLVQAASGDFYGTTYGGGAYGSGTVFNVTPSGALTTLYSFCSQSGCTDGERPLAGLVQATNGDFYGTASGGGANGAGTVFKITPEGTLTTLYSFCAQDSGCPDGAQPLAGLVQATNGDFYGTTSTGGANNSGTVFKITPSGALTTLYSFCSLSGCADGAAPYAGLVQGTDGDFYGTTIAGGTNCAAASSGCGTVFKITPSGALTTLYSFCPQPGCTDGSNPDAGLIQATNGTFYGTTDGGGTSTACSFGCGTVFSLSVGLGPFVETQRTSGMVGEVVKILGTDLTGATSVSFNGTAAAFTVVAPSLITTTVPAGATSGKVQVVTPSGTLSSNVPFRVLP
jgi:uncharacterized repeat protein (TIGR03803 family)